MTRPTIKLSLSIDEFDETPFLDVLERCHEKGILFRTITELGDGKENRQRLYELNKVCSIDIPGRGEFFSYEEFCERRYGPTYDPAGVFIAISEDEWVGMTATSNHQDRGFAFNEMTGVLRDFRRMGIAVSLKILSIGYAKQLPVKRVYTIHDFENTAAIDMNKRLGYKEIVNFEPGT
ncbi:MAG: GNAT family N-acetyltransferase [Pseudomonadales bacterium]|nr:GNAT family N-acetyltransferase [Pseudomonadales bacterium]MBO7006187.1 GNAT family N-acetyltransferase [Pseudomonadales bacterium]